MKKEDRKEKDTSFLMVPNDILSISSVPSLTEVDSDGKPTLIELTCTDKILYLTMKKRFDYFTSTKTPNKIGSSYYDSHGDVAKLCGVSSKTVTRFIKKWKDHGYIDYINFIGNKCNYTRFVDILRPHTDIVPVAAEKEDEDYFTARTYVNPEDEQEWRGY